MLSIKGRRPVALHGEKSVILALARGRLLLINLAFSLAYLLVCVRIVDLTVLQAGPDRTSSQEHIAQGKDIRRGKIYDRNGVLLASSLAMPSLYANPKMIREPDKVARGLASIFPELNPQAVADDLKETSKQFVWIKRSITPQEKRKVLELGRPGLSFVEEYRRVYPQGAMNAHLVGYTNVDSKGLAGVERGMEKALAGGKDVRLTLDVRLQHILRREIAKGMEEYSARAGAGVIMDAKSGEVLAASSLPDFDPHHPGRARQTEMFNRYALGAYELGSLFKIFSTAALLEYHDLPMDYSFDAREPLKVGRETINDYHAEKRVLSLPEVFIFSSNIGAALMGQMVGTERLRDFYKDLGLLNVMDIGIKEVAKPLVPDPWREIDTLTASFGHGSATTILQVAAAVSSIVNGGTIVRPHLLKKKTSSDGQAVRIVSEETSARMRALMRLVVTEGTASKAGVPGYQVGGKTGTAEKVGPNGRYDRNKLISSFVGIFPANAPRYVVLIMIDEPQGTKSSFGYATGGWVAAPAVARVIRAMATILNIPPVDVAESEHFGGNMKRYISFEGRDG